ncbi:MAG: hypothetical protein H7838_12140, partial [Magnetococcus sp. DMHC-8]
MNRCLKIAGLLWLLLWMSGCASLSNPFKGAPKSVSGAAAPFVEPQTRESTGLTRLWRESVA